MACFRLIRAVSSTLAAESQALSIASSTVGWLLLLLSKTSDGPLEVAKCRQVLQSRRPILVTDCKSLYDHLHSPSLPTSIEDRRTRIDVVIIRESCKPMKAHVWWVPTPHACWCIHQRCWGPHGPTPVMFEVWFVSNLCRRNSFGKPSLRKETSTSAKNKCCYRAWFQIRCFQSVVWWNSFDFGDIGRSGDFVKSVVAAGLIHSFVPHLPSRFPAKQQCQCDYPIALVRLNPTY